MYANQQEAILQLPSLKYYNNDISQQIALATDNPGGKKLIPEVTPAYNIPPL